MNKKAIKKEYEALRRKDNTPWWKEIDWKIISIDGVNVSEDFIRKYYKNLDWEYLSKYYILSEPLMRDFSHKLNFRSIVIEQRLSESFIADFHEKLYWEYIAIYPTLFYQQQLACHLMLRGFVRHLYPQ